MEDFYQDKTQDNVNIDNVFTYFLLYLEWHD